MIEKNDFEVDLKKIIKENTYISLDDEYFKIEFEINELVSEVIANYGNLKKCVSSKINKEV